MRLNAPWRETAGAAFAITFGAYVIGAILLGCRLAANVVKHGHSYGWIFGFFLLGGLLIPAYYFLKKPDYFGDGSGGLAAALQIYVVLALAHATWSLLITLASVPMTRSYQVISVADTAATWAVWIVAIVVVARLPWTVWRKLLWAALIVLLPFIAAPLRHIAFRA